MTAVSRAILLMATLLSACYAVAVLLEFLKPANGGTTAGIFYPGVPVENFIPFWGAIASWPLALALVLLRRKLIAAAVLVLPFVIDPVIDLVRFFPLTLSCLPTTAAAVWAIRRTQRLRRLPGGVLPTAFAGGLLVATGFGGSMNALNIDYAPAFLVWSKVQGMLAHPDLARLRDGSFQRELLAAKQLTGTLLAVDAGVFEELGKGLVIGAIYLATRQRWHGVASGIVVGATVGLGFNLLESVEYMTGDGAFQFWIRQAVGLFGAHTAFSALVGAGFGIAGRLADPRRRRLVIGLGFGMAICGHFANDSILTVVAGRLTVGDPTLSALVVQPLAVIALQLPFVLMYVLLLRKGMRDQSTAMAAGLTAAAADGSGAVIGAEVPILLDARRRFGLRLATFAQRGLPAYRWLTELHDRQLELGVTMAPELRARIIDMKRNPWVVAP